MPMISIGTSLTDVDTTPRYKIGAQFLESVDDKTSPTSANGERLWTYVKNGEGATSFTAGTLVMRKAATTTKECILANGTVYAEHRYVGYAQGTIPAGSYGWVLSKGWGTVLADATGISADDGLIPSNTTGGSVDNSATDTNFTLGWATTAIAASATGSAYVHCTG